MSTIKKHKRDNNIVPSQRRDLSNVISDGIWRGRRCFIVGGGLSLKSFDFSLLENELTIGINRAFEKFTPTISFFTDTRFWGWLEQGKFGQDALNKFHNLKSLKVALNYIDFPYPDDIQLINEVRGVDITFSMKNGIVLGGNSGFAALNLAICLGANPIYLLGFDMKGENGQQVNWHDGYPETAPAEVYDEMKIAFRRAASKIKRSGFNVINLNPDSELKCFDIGRFEDIEESAVFMEGYAGIGDNVWQRPFIKELAKNRTFYLMTFTPQIYWDIPNIKFVRPPYLIFKSHNKIADSLPKNIWSEKPKGIRVLKKPQYWVGFQAGITITELFEEMYPINRYDFSFPVKKEWVKEAQAVIDFLKTKGKKICIIHFPTIRNEWKCPARDPKPEYLQLLVDRYKDEYFFISLADLTNEVFTEEPRNIDKNFNYGELSLTTIFGLIKLADMVITGNCYLLPISLAIGTKIFGVYGGCQKPELFLDERMDLSNYGQVTPEPFCNCLNPGHDCYKDIPEEKIINEFEKLKDKKTAKKNILIYKVGPQYWHSFNENELLNERYDLIFEDDVPDLENYLKEHEIGAMISVDYPPERTRRICEKLNVNWLFCEAFLGKRCVFDKIGPHFDTENEIKEFVEKIPLKSKAKIPDWTKVEQPKTISKREFFKKYELSPQDKYIVLLGQEIMDKSIIHSKNPDIKNYEDYIYHLVMNNLDTKFLFKPHPVYKTIKKDKAHLIDYMYNYKNIIPIDEGLETLFNIFDKFTAYSSTTILEGLIQNRKFATVGYHFCNDDRIVLQLTTADLFKDLYKKLDGFDINQTVRKRYIHFLCNYYSIPLHSKQLIDRLELNSHEYFQEEY